MAIFFSWVLLFASASASAFVVNGSMGRDPTASMGQCLTVDKPSVSDAKEIIRISKLNVSENAKDEELVSLSWGIKQAIYLREGKPLIGLIGARVVYRDEKGVWNQSNGYIEVNRHWTDHGMNTRNVGMLMHELAHYVGNNHREDNLISYTNYFAAVPKPCCFSWYCKGNRNEEFADVFSTFLMNPENLLKEGGAQCKAAYEYFRKNVFPFGELSVCKKK